MVRWRQTVMSLRRRGLNKAESETSWVLAVNL